MLYKKNSAEKLSDELFENPTSEYRAAPFWAWNTKLETDQLMRQIEHMKKMGFGGFHMHSRTGLATEYLGDEFMAAVKACCDKAEDCDMLAWLYDEDRWSSGPAGGKVTKNKKYRRKRLMLFPCDKGWNMPREQALEAGEPYFLACYDVCLDADGNLEKYARVDASAAACGTKWYAYSVNEKESGWFNNQTYVDTLDREAMQEFINVTYKRYEEVIGDRFDKSVPAIFTDEPNANHERSIVIPTPEYKDRIVATWSRFFDEKFLEIYGWDILDRLPEVFWIAKDRSDSYVKYCYYDFIAEMFAECFSGQLGGWCDSHGIAFTGHLLREPKLEEQAVTCGEVMRNYGKFGIPGIDMLCDHIELTTAKQTQSAVHQYGKEGMLSELYGVTNWDFDFRGHKFQGDWQAALGVTVRVPHLTWLSMEGEAKRDYPASIGYQSPWYKEYPIIENHFARVNTALTRGTPIVKLGVIHPIESYWISAGPNSQTATQIEALETQFANITRWLLESHLDFDFICESQLPKLSNPNNPKAVGKMSYDAILVPGCHTLRQSTVSYLEKFVSAGGKIVFAGNRPEYIDGVKGEISDELYGNCEHVGFDKDSIREALEPCRTVSLRWDSGYEADDLVYNYRRDNDCNWLFIAHFEKPHSPIYGFSTHELGTQYDVLKPENVTVTLKGEFTPVEYNTMTGKMNAIFCRYENGNTVFEWSVNALDSLLVKLLPKTESVAVTKPAEYTEICKFDIKHALEYKLEEPNVLLLDLPEYAFDGEEYRPREDSIRIKRAFRKKLGYDKLAGSSTQPYAVPDEPTTHVLHLRYEFESEIAVTDAVLALEKAEISDISFNGAPVKKEITGYFTDEAIKTVKLPEIKIGKNTLVIDLPFGKRTDVESCFILGAFGVRLCGSEAVITQKPTKLGFGDIAVQGHPFYGANVTYITDIDVPEDGAVKVHSSYYRGSLIGVSLDGKRVGNIVLPPYDCVIENVSAGKHKLELTLFGNRHNSFGALHAVKESRLWFGPDAWRTEGDDWGYEYITKRFGILKSPVITVMK